MIDPAEHIVKARRSIQTGRLLLEAGYCEEAGRDAYMAAFHAALAYIVAATGKEPKSHRGVQIEFARLQFERKDVERDFVTFLTQAYEFKDISDYQIRLVISEHDAKSALETSFGLIEVIVALLPGHSAT